MALVLRKPPYSLFTTSVEAIWVGKRLKMMNSLSILKGWAPTQETWLGSIPHLFQPFLFGHLEGCPTTGSLGDVPSITMVINHLHPVGWIWDGLGVSSYPRCGSHMTSSALALCLHYTLLGVFLEYHYRILFTNCIQSPKNYLGKL